jgi:Holliday junction resolvase-like predicted endonuclease
MSGAGTQAEEQALAFLLARGLALKQRNYRCRLGEIDLILMDGKALVFVEVRMRRSPRVRRRRRKHYATQTRAPACGRATLSRR